MLYLYTGTDREKVRTELNKAVGKVQGASTLHVSDANSIADLAAVLQGGGMFGGKRAIILENVLENDEMRQIILPILSTLVKSSDEYFIFEEKPDASTRRTLEKYAENSQRFDAPKGKKEGSDIFVLATALRRGDKKTLWVLYQRSLLRGERAEQIHGVLFWGAKQALLGARASKEHLRAERIVAELVELPHESRRHGFDLEYALERYLLSF